MIPSPESWAETKITPSNPLNRSQVNGCRLGLDFSRVHSPIHPSMSYNEILLLQRSSNICHHFFSSQYFITIFQSRRWFIASNILLIDSTSQRFTLFPNSTRLSRKFVFDLLQKLEMIPKGGACDETKDFKIVLLSFFQFAVFTFTLLFMLFILPVNIAYEKFNLKN